MAHFGAAVLECLDLLVGQKAHLAVPRRSVGVALDAPVGPKLDDGLLGFLDSLDICLLYTSASCQAHGPHGGHGAKAEEGAAVHLHRFFAHSPSCIVDLSCVDERCDWPSQCVIMEELRDRGHRLRAVIREITSLR